MKNWRHFLPLLLIPGMVACSDSDSRPDIANRVGAGPADGSQPAQADYQFNPGDQTPEGWVDLPSGVRIKTLRQGTGEMPKPGDQIKVHYTGILQDGTKFDSSVDRGDPFQFKLGMGSVIPCWDEGMARLRVGTRAYLYCPSALAYGPTGSGKIPPNADLTFEVEVLGIVSDQWNVSGMSPITTESGLQIYQLSENEGGSYPQVGQTVFVHYTGYLPNGKKFDSSHDRGQPFSFPLGQGGVIAGWDEGIRLLRTGERVKWVIPGDLAYGERGYPGLIPPNTTLTFDVEFLSVQ